MAIGVLAASVSIRLMESLVIINRIEPLKTFGSSFHYGAFLMVDVLLTGAILAGGSIFIHQIFAVYDNFMDSTKRRARALNQAKADE